MGPALVEPPDENPAHQYFDFFFKEFFFVGDIFKVFIELVTILLLFYVFSFWLRGMWDS